MYDCGSDKDGDGSRDPEALVVGSVDLGSSNLVAVSASNDWDTDYGYFDFFVSYTHSDVDDIGYGTSSTATSNYSDFTAYDRQRPTEGTSSFQTEHMLKMRFNWSKELIEGYQY